MKTSDLIINAEGILRLAFESHNPQAAREIGSRVRPEWSMLSDLAVLESPDGARLVLKRGRPFFAQAAKERIRQKQRLACTLP